MPGVNRGANIFAVKDEKSVRKRAETLLLLLGSAVVFVLFLWTIRNRHR